MKRHPLISIAALMAIILLLPFNVLAEDDDLDLTGMVSIITRTVDGERDSSKFEEYRDIPDGVSGKVRLGYRSDRYFFDLKAKDIAEDDQYFRLRSGLYGKFKVEIIYDKIPHRFAYDARTLYSGIGSGTLVLSDAVQSALEATAGDDVARANLLNDFLTSGNTVDLELFRKTGKANIDVMAFDPLDFRIEFRREERDGTRPFSGTFGFGHFEEIAEPIDYDTTEVKFIADYVRKPYYLSASYTLSIFDNNTNTLSWDNPFQLADTDGAGGVGRIDLAPDNNYHNITLTGSVMDLPYKSRLTATASWGWMNQDDDLIPFTTNTAIPLQASLTTFCASGLPSDPACLPISSADLEVKTSLYNVVLTSRPVDFLRAKAKLRYYERDNDSGSVTFPGYVPYDSSWNEETVVTEPVSYDRLTTGIDLTFDVARRTDLTVGYTFDTWDRTHREALDSDENIYSISVNSKPLEWLDLRASYEKSNRDVDYDFTVPFEQSILNEGGIIDGNSVPQLPLLRKYDEADRDRDNAQLIATVYPTEQLTVAGSIIYEKNDYDNSAFGLTKDKRQIYSIDADYDLSKRVSLSAYYSHERYEDNQRARQWRPTAGCIIDGDGTSDECTDPYSAVPGVDSPSNWEAEHDDRTNTFGAGIKVAVLPERLDLKVNYLYSKTNGRIDFQSAVGANNDVDSNNFVPISFDNVDDIERQLLKLKAIYSFARNVSVTLGYMWEKFDVDDFDNTGFQLIPLDADEFNGAILMGTIPRDYEANVVYGKVSYTF
jgi:MtrB/PioB family decaheme-associated outer membrane protein